VVVSHDIEYGEVTSSAWRFTPSSLNCTPDTPMLSDAVAVMVMVFVTLAPFAGDVIETSGGAVSPAHTEEERVDTDAALCGESP
jgi:hypothetical protein